MKKGDLILIKKYTVGIATLLIAVFLVACGDDNNEASDANQEASQSVDIKDEEKVPEDDVVATVNGEDVTGKSYNLVYAQLKLFAGQMGEEVDTDEIKNATMESLIDRAILMQHAKEEGIEVTDEDASKELDTIKEENEDGLSSLLEQYQMSEDDFIDQLQFELTLNEFKEKEIDVDVTEEDIEEAYKEAKEENEEIPELDEIKDQLKGNIQEQKTNEALQKKIDDIREKADIEEKLEA